MRPLKVQPVKRIIDSCLWLVDSCLWLVILVVQLGCTPVTTTLPLSDPWASKPEERLLGRWEVVESVRGLQEEVPDAFFQITRGGTSLPHVPNCLYEARVVEFTPDGPVVLGDYYFFPSTVNGQTFVNAIETDAFQTSEELQLQLERARKNDGDSSPLRWSLFRYELKGDELVILGDSYTETLHGPRESLREFINGYGERIFTRGAKLKRTNER